MPTPPASPPPQPYGDPTLLNRSRVILDAVGQEILTQVVGDFLDLLGTSAAVYEKNGDYALGIFSSGWCRRLDARSRELCDTDDNAAALACGRWHCHESCWRISAASIADARATDLPCLGGIRIHAVPIMAGDEVIGSINFGYGEPTHDAAELAAIAERYGITVEELGELAAQHPPRSAFQVELAKSRLATAARLIGEIVQRRRAEAALREANATLEQRVAERTAALQEALRELDAFSYSVSHDLRAPLRAVAGFTRILLEEHADGLSEEGRRYLRLVQDEGQRMSRLIQDLLVFSHLGKAELKVRRVEPADLVNAALERLAPERFGRAVEVAVADLPACHADPGLLGQVFENLLANAHKFTRGRDPARIEVGSMPHGGGRAYFVRDNGVGFDMRYADRLFRVFQRLHRAEDYEGTGVGLALVQRIVQRHGGRVWAEARPEEGATFYFTVAGEDRP